MRKLRYSLDDPRVIACRRAVALAGGFTEVGKAFGLTAQAVYCWEIISAERCHEMEALSGISIYELRPDIFGLQPAKAS